MQKGSRPGAAVLLCGALLVLPLLLIRNGPVATAASPPDGGSTHPSASSPLTGAANPALHLTSATSGHRVAVTTTTVTVAPTPSATTTAPLDPAEAPVREVTQRAVPAVTSTTVTVAPTTTTSQALAVAAPTGSVHYGQVTYYAHPAGTCASPFLAFGTVVEITNPANGASVSCVVNDREADTARSIDLATDTFAELAPLPQGVIDAQLTW